MLNAAPFVPHKSLYIIKAFFACPLYPKPSHRYVCCLCVFLSISTKTKCYTTSQRKQIERKRNSILVWFGLKFARSNAINATDTEKTNGNCLWPPVDVLCLQVIPSFSFFLPVIRSLVGSFIRFSRIVRFMWAKRNQFTVNSLLDILRIYSHFNVNETKWPVDKSVHIHQKSHRCISCQMYLLLLYTPHTHAHSLFFFFFCYLFMNT